MAHISQTISPGIRTIPFSGRPPGDAINNIYPRARVIFEGTGSTLAKIATNTQTVLFRHTLPANFAYSIGSIFISAGDGNSLDVANYENLSLGQLQFNEGAAFDIEFQLNSLGSILNTPTAAAKAWRPHVPVFGEVFFNQTGFAPVLDISILDNDAGATEALATVTYVSFLQYDILQADMVAVNAPMPVSVR